LLSKPRSGLALSFVPLLAASIGCSSDKPKPSDASEGFLTSPDGAQIHFQVEGSGPDTVVVVHGGPGAGAGTILPDLEPLNRRHVVIYYDQRGGGRSELPADTARLNAQAFVEDLEAVRTHFHLSSLKLVAHSFGSVVAAQYAANHPTRIARIVLLAATGPSAKQAALFYQRGPVGLDSATAVRQFLALESLMDGTASDPILACRTFEDLGRVAARNRGEFAGWKGTSCGMPVAALRYYWRYTARLGPEAFGSWDFTQSLKRLPAPLLVISGGSDTNAVAMDSAWAAALPNARLLRMPSTSRAAYAELPELTFTAIDEFLAGSWPRTATPAS
jgi:proline iminopeptidase